MNDEGILDTNVVIGLSKITDPAQRPKHPLVTTITVAELSVGPHLASNDIERAARQTHFQQAESNFEPLSFDSAAARAFGCVASDRRSKGKKSKARAYDALIAAIVITSDLPLYIANPEDFTGISELTVVTVPAPSS